MKQRTRGGCCPHQRGLMEATFGTSEEEEFSFPETKSQHLCKRSQRQVLLGVPRLRLPGVSPRCHQATEPQSHG